VLVDSGNTDLAAARLEESLVLWHQLGEQVDIAECLEGIAAIAVADGDDMRAAQLWGVVAALRSTTGAVISPVDQARFSAALQRMAGRNNPEALQAAHTAGQVMTLAQAVIFTLSEDDQDAPYTGLQHR